MSTLRIDAFTQTPLQTQPYEHLVVRDFLTREGLDAARRDFPRVSSPGSHPPAGMQVAGGFKQLVDDIHGPDFRAAVESKFGIDLAGRPLMYTIRGHCRARDGKIHTDTRTKIITVLLYLNDDHWNSAEGRLRLLRNGHDLDDYAEEIEPAGGTLLVFKRSDHSWHGHTSFEGPRRALQFNWVTDQSVVDREQNRHGLSAFVKKLLGRDAMMS